MKGYFGILAVIIIASLKISATTWNEPWHDEVVRLADVFVRVQITESSGSRATGKVVKLLGGIAPGDSITIKGFSKLELESISDQDELSLPFKVGDEYYLLVKRDTKTGYYQLPTPTSGWAWVDKGDVYATYRHSYHQALVPVDIYEKTMLSIFNAAKGKPVEESVLAFVKSQLSEPPANLTNDLADPVAKRFFLQHVALETVFHTGVVVDVQQIEPFLQAAGAQVQISAARVLGRIKTPTAQERLIKFIEGSGVGFAKVMCVWALRDQNARGMTPRLQEFMKKGKDQETGFGGSIMDPRVGTFFPSSVKDSIKGLLAEWKEPAKRT
jgi:hypothetical protein